MFIGALLPLTEASYRHHRHLPLSERMQFDPTPLQLGANVPETMHFFHQFEGCMELSASHEQVSQYLDAHQEWFCRCAHPMQVEPIGNNGYTLLIGRYGSFGFEIEPQISLHLLPQNYNLYRIETIPALPAARECYDVDFRASLRLVDQPAGEVATSQPTRVQWDLDLDVAIAFPAFIRRLPLGLIQYTGDRILQLIVQQVSQRLMAKVQADFHATLTGTPHPA